MTMTPTPAAPSGELPTMRAAFRTTESCGPENRYLMVFKFPSLADLDKADDEWRAAVSQAAPEQATPHRVAEFWSSANPGNTVRMLAEGDEIVQWPKRSDFIRWVGALAAPSGAPIQMILHCPKCGLQHVDAPDARKFPAFGPGMDVAPWTNPPHKSHLCHGCGNIWRPADVPTEGVKAIKTSGKADSPVAPSGAPKQDTPQSICTDSRFMDALDGYMDVVTNDPRNSDRRVKCRLEVFAAADAWRAAASTVQSAPVLPAEDARDAARYRWLTQEQGLRYSPAGGRAIADLDAMNAAIDADMGAAQSTPVQAAWESLGNFAEKLVSDTPVQVEGQQEQTLQPSCDSALHAEPAGRVDASFGDWISVDERLPEQRCIATYLTGGGKRRQIIATYVPRFTVKAEGDECYSEINDADDEEYLRQGWYECIDNWGDFSSIFVNEGEVTHWTPQPPTPEQSNSAGSARQGGEHAPEIVQAGALPVAAAPEQKP